MTTVGIGNAAPLPAREGLGVGSVRAYGSPSPDASRTASTPPTPAPSLAGRGETGIASGLSRVASQGNLDKAGKQFEAVFTSMMLKSMRQAKLADPLFDSKALDTFREMQDAQVAQTMAEHAPLGIGKAMVDFLARAEKNASAQSDLNQPAAIPPA